MKKLETIGRCIWSYHDSLDWLSYVSSLRVIKPLKTSKTSREILLIFGKRTLIKIARQPKWISEDELGSLASEYEKPEAELRELLTDRKIKILNAAGEQTNVRIRQRKGGRPPKGKKEENVGSEPAG